MALSASRLQNCAHITRPGLHSPGIRRARHGSSTRPSPRAPGVNHVRGQLAQRHVTHDRSAAPHSRLRSNPSRPWSPSLGSSLTPLARRHPPQPPACAALAKDGAQGRTAPEDALARALRQFKEAFSGLPSESFSSLPGDLKAELKDAGFALSSGPVLLELGEDLGTILLELGGGMEAATSAPAMDAAASLAARLDAGAAPPGSSSRAALGRRLQASALFLTGMGAIAPRDIQQLGKAMSVLGSELSLGSREKAVNAAAVYGRRSIKIGALEFEVTPAQAAQGSFVAALFSLAAWRVALVVESSGEGSTSLASEGANLVATSLRQTLLLVGYGSASLSLVTCIGLGLLAFQLSGQSEEK